MAAHFSDLGDLGALFSEHYLKAVEHTIAQTSLYWDSLGSWKTAVTPAPCRRCGEPTFGLKGRAPFHHLCWATRFRKPRTHTRSPTRVMENRHERRRRGLPKLTWTQNAQRCYDRRGGADEGLSDAIRELGRRGGGGRIELVDEDDFYDDGYEYGYRVAD